MKKILVMVLVVFMTVCLMVGCSQNGGTPEESSAAPESSSAPAEETSEAPTEESSAAADGDETLHLGAVVMDVSNEYHKSILDGAQYFCDERGYQFTGADGASDVTRQVTALENMVQAGVDGVDVRMFDEAAFDDVVQLCKDHNVKLAVYPPDHWGADISLQNGDYENGYELGKTAAEWIKEKYDGKCEVAIIQHSNNAYLLQRIDGYRDALAEFAPDAEIVATEDALDIIASTNATENILAAHPDVKVFLCIADMHAGGCAEAIDSSGVNTDDFFVGGIDAEQHIVDRIEAGGSSMKATVGTTMLPQTIAYEMMVQLEKCIKGEEYGDVTITPYVITQDTIDQYREDVASSWPPKS